MMEQKKEKGILHFLKQKWFAKRLTKDEKEELTMIEKQSYMETARGLVETRGMLRARKDFRFERGEIKL